MAALRIAFAGCGNIAPRYAKTIAVAGGLELVGATDIVPGAAERFAAEHGGTAYDTLDELLADPAVDVLVNLTAPQAHAAVTRAALEAGKHVHTEKPLALRYEDARELVELAKSRGLRLSSAPATLLGEAQQTMWKLVRDGAIGRVRVAYAEANWGRLERWHPDPTSLYGVGPLVDVGVYPMTILTAMFGPVRRVQAYGTIVEPDRIHGDGRPFRVEASDFVVASLDLADGVAARVTASFYVPASKQRGLELHGDEGSLYMPTWDVFDTRVERQERGGEYEPVPLLRDGYPGIDWSRALTDLAQAIAEGRSHRMSGEHAAHIVEVLEGAQTSIEGGGAVEIRSDFPRPAPLDWAS